MVGTGGTDSESTNNSQNINETSNSTVNLEKNNSKSPISTDIVSNKEPESSDFSVSITNNTVEKTLNYVDYVIYAAILIISILIIYFLVGERIIKPNKQVKKKKQAKQTKKEAPPRKIENFSRTNIKLNPNKPKTNKHDTKQ